MPEPTDGTRRAVGDHYLLTELGLVDSDKPFLCDVGPSRLSAGFEQLVPTHDLLGIEADGDRQ